MVAGGYTCVGVQVLRLSLGGKRTAVHQVEIGWHWLVGWSRPARSCLVPHRARPWIRIRRFASGRGHAHPQVAHGHVERLQVSWQCAWCPHDFASQHHVVRQRLRSLPQRCNLLRIQRARRVRIGQHSCFRECSLRHASDSAPALGSAASERARAELKTRVTRRPAPGQTQDTLLRT